MAKLQCAHAPGAVILFQPVMSRINWNGSQPTTDETAVRALVVGVRFDQPKGKVTYDLALDTGLGDGQDEFYEARAIRDVDSFYCLSLP